jgi:hypothetical protein
LHELRSIEHQGWQFIITLDKSCFNLAANDEQIWLRPDQGPPERPRHTIEGRKMMVTIAWNPLGFRFVEALPKGRILHAEYYRDNILMALIPLLSAPGERQLVIMQTVQGPTLLKNVEPWCRKWDVARYIFA